MDNRASMQLKDLVEKNNSIGIAVGKNPGVDEMAAALSLYLALKEKGKNANIVCPTEPLVEHSRLIGIDKVKNSFELNGGDMIVSFPYEEGEIEKISYTLENGLLNIVVKSGEKGLSFSEKDVMFKRSEGYPLLLFVIGTSRLSDLDRIYDPQALKDTQVVNIDNKPDNQGYGDISIVSPTSSSISEKIAELMFSMGFNIDIDIAQNLLRGIENATSDFQNSKTTPLAFEITGELIRKGAIRGTGNNLNTRGGNYSDSQDVDSVIGPSNLRQRQQRPFPRQSLGQRLVRQPSAGQTFQSLQEKPIGQELDSSEDDLNIERKDRKEPLDSSSSQLENSLQSGSRQSPRGKKPPVDWLAPKIYKGSTNI